MDTGEGVKYTFIDQVVNFDAAKTYCKNNGFKRLAIVKTDAEFIQLKVILTMYFLRKYE